MELKIKDFASMQGVSESIIYRHIRQHKEALGDRVIKRGNATWLTEEGQDYIRGLMTQQPIVVGSTDQQQEIDQLRQQVSALQDKLIQTQERLLSAQELITEGQTARLALEAAKKENSFLEGFLQDANAEIRIMREEKAASDQKATEAAQQAVLALQEAQEARSREEAALAAQKSAEARMEALKALPWYKKWFWKGE